MSLNPWSPGLFDRVFPGADINGESRKQVLSPNSDIAMAIYRMLYDSRYRPSFNVVEMTAILLLRSKNREATMTQILESFRRLPYVYRVLHQGNVAGKADVYDTLRKFHCLPKALIAGSFVTSVPALGDQVAPGVEMTVPGLDADSRHWREEVGDSIHQLGEPQATTALQKGLAVSATGTWILFAGEEDAAFEDWYLHERKIQDPAHIPSPIGRLPEELMLKILKYVLYMRTSLRIRAYPQPGIYPQEVQRPCRFIVQTGAYLFAVANVLDPLLVDASWNRVGKEAFYVTNVFEMLDHRQFGDWLPGLSSAARFLELMGTSTASDSMPRYGLIPLSQIRNIKVEHRGWGDPDQSERAMHTRIINAAISMPKLGRLQFEHHMYQDLFYTPTFSIENFLKSWPACVDSPGGCQSPESTFATSTHLPEMFCNLSSMHARIVTASARPHKPTIGQRRIVLLV